jgi:outer membrane protein assembly factor BamB
LRRLLSLFAILAIASPAAAAPPPGGEATAEGITPANDSYQAASTIRPPYYQRWSRPLRLAVPAPIIADGRVYVSASGTQTTLMALDVATGATDWSVNEPSAHLAYDDGTLFASTFGDLTAYDAASGAVLWSLPKAGSDFALAPVAMAGNVYYADQGMVTAVGDAGTILWSTAVPLAGPPTLSATNIFAADGCTQATGLDFLGAVLWHPSPCLRGVTGEAVAYGNGRVFTTPLTGADGTILDADTGSQLRQYRSTGGLPAVVGDTMIAQANGVVSAADAASGATSWTTHVGPSYLGPVVAGSVVIAGAGDPTSPWHLLFLNLPTGKVLDSLAGPVGAADFGPPAVTAGEGIILVASGASLIALDSTYRRVTRTVEANAFLPAANASWEAWTDSNGGWYEARTSSSPLRVDHNAFGYTGNIDGNRIVYQRPMRGGIQDQIAVTVAGQIHHKVFGRFVNDGAWLWQPTLSGNWLLYNHGEDTKTHSVVLANLKKKRVKTLAKGNPKKLWVGAGQVAGNYAVWVQCRKGHWCIVERRTLSSGHTVILRAPGMDLSNPAVTPAGVVYALAAGRESSCPAEYMARWKPGALEDLYAIPANHLAFNLDAGMLTDGRVDVRYELDTCTRSGKPYENDEFVDRTDIPALTAAPLGAPRSVAAPGSRVPVTERSYAAPPGSVTTMRQPRG